MNIALRTKIAPVNGSIPNTFPQNDLVVFSHLRWDFVFQRPQHILSRFAKHRRVYFVEEPVFTGIRQMEILCRENSVKLVIPHLPEGMEKKKADEALADLLSELMQRERITDYTAWYYTPMALSFSRHLRPATTVYDCMDELSLFKGAPPQLLEYEEELFKKADVVFTGGQSLYEAKKARHSNIHAFPSSIDAAHFRQARQKMPEPADQARITGPRIGFFGVLDERFDIELVANAARLRPDWQFVMIGPVVKISPDDLPRLPNIHYLGKKDYRELPAYLSGWDLAILPFARNDSTRFISPTKTPEYLAAGRPVVSTSIRDVVQPYGVNKLVYIADSPEEFIDSATKAMSEAKRDSSWLTRVDQFLAEMSWEQTCARMAKLEGGARSARNISEVRLGA